MLAECVVTTSEVQDLAGFDESSIDVNGRVIRYLDGGVGDVLVVIHGSSGWRANLTEVHTALATGYRVIALELPGFGETPGDGIDSVRDLAGVVIRFLAELRVERCCVIGTSIGAAVGLWVAIDAPYAVDKLVLEAPVAFREGAPPPGPPPGGGPRPGAGRPPEPARFAYLDRILGPATDPALVAAMPDCPVATLVLFGEDDQMSPPRLTTEYRRLPAVNLAIVYAAGHDIKGTRPEAYLATVTDFLRRGPGFVVSQTSTVIYA